MVGAIKKKRDREETIQRKTRRDIEEGRSPSTLYQAAEVETSPPTVTVISDGYNGKCDSDPCGLRFLTRNKKRKRFVENENKIVGEIIRSNKSSGSYCTIVNNSRGKVRNNIGDEVMAVFHNHDVGISSGGGHGNPDGGQFLTQTLQSFQFFHKIEQFLSSYKKAATPRGNEGSSYCHCCRCC